MPQLALRTLLPHIVDIERARGSRVLVLAASQLDTDTLPAVYERCLELGRTARLDVVLHGRGGEVNATRRLALLLRAQCDHLAFIVPFHCASSATLLTLCADEIVAGPLALFSPIDPLLNGADGSACSALDIQRFGEMAEQWFGLARDEAGAEALALLCNSVFPPSLVAFYRVTREVTQVALELLAFQLRGDEGATRERIVNQLMAGYHSHSYAITGDELAALGLRVRSDAGVMAAAWGLSRWLQMTIGGGLRDEPSAPWDDMLIATRDCLAIRRRQPSGLGTAWITEQGA